MIKTDKKLHELALQVLNESTHQLSPQVLNELEKLVFSAIWSRSMNTAQKSEISQAIKDFVSNNTELQKALALAFGEYFQNTYGKTIKHFDL